MRRYENIYILHPELPDDEYPKINEKFQNIISSFGGRMLSFDDWGKRKLAYEISKFSKGYYFVYDFAGNAATVNELERNLKIDEKVIRFQTIKLEDEFDIEDYLARRETEQKMEPERKIPEEYEPPEKDDSELDRGEESYDEGDDSFEKDEDRE
ncbi:MAG: 30S ribosomal protein S6 [Deltaproteobacteria bacterium]|nr:30S ribosomal protein S6 [Deltaproteobacteria bacterium]